LPCAVLGKPGYAYTEERNMMNQGCHKQPFVRQDQTEVTSLVADNERSPVS
jgi:hypothetical protein